MPVETFQVSKEDAQILHVEELVKHNAGLTVKLKIAETEIGRLRLVVERLEDGQVALMVKLEDANSEVGRLGMLLKQHAASLESPGRHPLK